MRLGRRKEAFPPRCLFAPPRMQITTCAYSLARSRGHLLRESILPYLNLRQERFAYILLVLPTSRRDPTLTAQQEYPLAFGTQASAGPGFQSRFHFCRFLLPLSKGVPGVRLHHGANYLYGRFDIATARF